MHTRPWLFRCRKIPSWHRSFGAAAVVPLLVACSGGRGTGPTAHPLTPPTLASPSHDISSRPGFDGELSEADVIRLATTQDPEAIAARYEAALTEARRAGVGVYPNPSVTWDREHFPTSPREREDAVSVTVPVDWSSRRSTQRHLAAAEASAAQAVALRKQSDVVVRALNLYYELIAAQESTRINLRASKWLDEAARIVSSRKAAGKTSGYDQVRIEIEAELATSELARSRARGEVVRAELALVLGVDEASVVVSAAAEPNPAVVVSAAAEAAPASPSLGLLRAAQAQTRKARTAASWAWVPTVAVTGGLRIGDADDTRYGYVAGISVDVPVFANGQALRAEAQARENLARARVREAQRLAQIRLARARRTLVAALHELRRFDVATRDRVERLERAAEAGYREGQQSLVELLDARRTRSSVERRRLELATTVKQAEAALRAAGGEFE